MPPIPPTGPPVEPPGAPPTEPPAAPVAAPPPAPPEPPAGPAAATAHDGTPTGPLPEAAAARRPRGRTAALIAGAAVLGVLTGVITGYAVQYDRPPTPLPPLSQPAPRTPEAAGDKDGPEPLSAREDRIVRTGGDLRKLLLKKPKDAQTPPGAPDGDWMAPARYSKGFNNPAGMFEELAHDGLRRIAAVSWKRGDGALVSIRLVQFRDSRTPYSVDFLENQQWYMSDDAYAGNDGEPVPGTASGRAYVYDRPHTEAGYPPVYAARALARRGDIVMEISVYGRKAIGRGTIMSLAERQLERL